MRRSTSISLALARKGVLTDLDGDGVADCDRAGHLSGGESGVAEDAVTYSAAVVTYGGDAVIYTAP